MDPAQLLLRGETLAVHLRLSGNRGLFGIIEMMPRRETQNEQSSHTNRERDSQVPPSRRVQWAVTEDGFVCDCVMSDSQEASATGLISDISTIITGSTEMESGGF